MKSRQGQILYIKLANILREQIQSGLIKPGEMLMSEHELSAFYGMSRISVRKSLEILAKEGLIVRKPGHGTTVAQADAGQEDGRRKLHLCVTSPSFFVDHCLAWVIEAYEKEHSDVRVVAQRLQSIHFWESLEHTRNIGFRPDLLLVSESQYSEIDDIGSFREIGLSPEQEQAIYPKLDRFFRRDGRRVAVPITFSPVFMAYNPDLFEQYDVPKPSRGWTTEQFLDAAAKLTKDTDGDGIVDLYGLSLNPSISRWPVVALQNGVQFAGLSSDPEPLRDTLRLMHRMLYHDRIAIVQATDRYSHYAEPFVHEKAAMVLTTAMGLAEWVQAGLRFRPLVCSMPFGPQRSTLLRANALMVPDSCSDPELVHSFIRFAIRPDIQESLHKQFHFLSVLMPVNERVCTQAYLFSTNLHDRGLPHCHFLNDIFGSWQTMEKLDIQLQLFWKGLESVDNAMLRIRQSDSE